MSARCKRSTLIDAFLIPAALVLLSCEQERPALPREPWMDLPQDQWPPIVLSNHIQLGGMNFQDKACAFLVHAGADTFAVTCKHLFLAFQSPDIQSIHFGGRLKTWAMYPKGSREDTILVDELLNADPDEKIIKQYVINRDWLIFSMAKKSFLIQPLRPRFGELEEDEKLYLIGWTEDDAQRAYEGKLYKAFDYKYLVDVDGRDLAGLSGAPVIDANGYLVGINSGGLGEFLWVNSTRYLKEVLENRE